MLKMTCKSRTQNVDHKSGTQKVGHQKVEHHRAKKKKKKIEHKSDQMRKAECVTYTSYSQETERDPSVSRWPCESCKLLSNQILCLPPHCVSILIMGWRGAVAA